METSRLNISLGIIALILCLCVVRSQGQTVTIPIETDSHAIVLQTDKNNILRTVYFGKRLLTAGEYGNASSVNRLDDENAGIYNAAYTPSGTWNLSEPAIEVKHADGNPSLELKYVSFSQEQLDGNTNLTRVILKDNAYPFQVMLFYKVWKNIRWKIAISYIFDC